MLLSFFFCQKTSVSLSAADAVIDGAAEDGAEVVKLSPTELAEGVQEEQDSASA